MRKDENTMKQSKLDHYGPKNEIEFDLDYSMPVLGAEVKAEEAPDTGSDQAERKKMSDFFFNRDRNASQIILQGKCPKCWARGVVIDWECFQGAKLCAIKCGWIG